MGGLNSGPGPGIAILIAFVLLLAETALTAPLFDEDEAPEGSQALAESHGCYYNFQHYNEGERILTNEPCLNCTCRNRMLMCYLRVCPFTKGIGQNCTVEKVPGQCCPIITCPEVPVQLLTSTTTEQSGSSYHKNTAVGHLDENGCNIEGIFYPNGAQVPGNPERPCELCYCIRNKTSCIMQTCALHVDGCRPVYEEGQCFPVRYQCDDSPYEEEATTTIRPAPTPGLIITTTSSEPLDCTYNNEIFEDGSRIRTEDPCEHCYCLKGKIACAVQECGAPLEKEGQNCTALPSAPGKCCPDSYQCDNNVIVRANSESFLRKDRKHKFEYKHKPDHNDITTTSHGTTHGSEETTEPEIPSGADAGHPTNEYYGTSENPNQSTNRFDKVTEGTQDTTVQPELDRGTQKEKDSQSTPTDDHLTGLRPAKPGSSSDGEKMTFSEDKPETDAPALHVPGEKKPHPESDSHQHSTGEEKRPLGAKPSEGAHTPETGTSDSKDPLLDKLHNIIQDVQAQVNDGKTTEMPEEAEYQTTTQSQKGHFTEKPDSLTNVHLSTPHTVTDGTNQETQTPSIENGGDIINKLQGIIHGIYSHVTDSIMTTKKPEGTTEGLESQTSQPLSTGAATYPHGVTGTLHQTAHPGGSTESTMSSHGTSGVTRIPTGTHQYPDGSKQQVKPFGTSTSEHQGSEERPHGTEYPEGTRKPEQQNQSSDHPNKNQEGPNPTGSLSPGHPQENVKPAGQHPHGSEFPQKPGEIGRPDNYPEKPGKPQSRPHGTEYPEEEYVTGKPDGSNSFPEKKPSSDNDPDGTEYPEEATGKPGFRPTGVKRPLKPGQYKPHVSDKYPESGTESPDENDVTGRPEGSGTHPENDKLGLENFSSGTEYPEEVTGKPGSEFAGASKYPSGSKRPLRPGQYRPHDSDKYPVSHVESETSPYGTEYPEEEDVTDKPDGLENEPFGTDHPEGVTKRPEYKPSAVTKYPYDTLYPSGSKRPVKPGYKPHGSSKYPDTQYGTEYPEGGSITERPDSQGNYPEESKPGSEDEAHGAEYPEGVTGKPEHKPTETTKHPDGSWYTIGSKRPIRPGYKPHGSDEHPETPFGTEHSEEEDVTGRPESQEKYPAESKPGSENEFQGTEYPEGVTERPGFRPTKHPIGSKRPARPEQHKPNDKNKTGTSKYPDDDKPEDDAYVTAHPDEHYVTGRPDSPIKFPDSDDPAYGTEYPDGTTGRPGFRPTISGHYPQRPGSQITHGSESPHQTDLLGKPDSSAHPQGNQYPDTTSQPEVLNKHPDSSKPQKHGTGNEPEATSQHPHHSNDSDPTGDSKYPGEEQPAGTHRPHGTEYPQGIDVTGKPSESNKSPEGAHLEDQDKYPQGSKYPHRPGVTVGPQYSEKPHGTEYPEGAKPSSENEPHGSENSDEAPDQPGYKPTGTSKYPDGSLYPSHSNRPLKPGYKPHGTEKYPNNETEYPEENVTGRPDDQNKYPEAGKPDSEDEAHGSEYPEGVTGHPGFRPTKRPLKPGYKPQHSDKYPETPYGTEYPEEDGVTKRPSGITRFPDGSEYPHSSVGPELSKPNYEDKIETSKHPEEEKPNPEDVAHSTEYPEGATGRPGFRPTGTIKYPSGSKHPVRPGDEPHDSDKYPGVPNGTEYPEENGVTGRPDSQGKFPEGVKPGSEGELHGTEYPEGVTGRPTGTTRFPDGSEYPHGSEKPVRPGSFKPHDEDKVGTSKHPEDGKPGTEDELYGSEYPEGTTDRPGFRPTGTSKYPSGSKRPVRPVQYPVTSHGTEYPKEDEVTGRPSEGNKYPEKEKPGSENDFSGTEYPEVNERPTKYPSGSKRPVRPGHYEPQSLDKNSESETEYPGESETTEQVDGFTEYPKEGKPDEVHGTKYSEKVTTRPAHSPIGTTKYPSHTKRPEIQGRPKPEFQEPHEAYDLEGSGLTGTPEHSTYYPHGSKHPGKPGEEPFGTEYPEVTGRPDGLGDGSLYPVGSKRPLKPEYAPEDSDKHPETPYGTEYPETDVTGSPDGGGKYPEGEPDFEHKPHGTVSSGTTKYPSGKPVQSQGSTKRPGMPDSGLPDDLKHPENADVSHMGPVEYPQKPTAEDQLLGTEHPESFSDTSKPDEKYPDGAKPEEGHPHYSGATGRPEDTDKHPEGIKPGHYPHSGKPSDSKRPTGSEEKPEESNKYPEKDDLLGNSHGQLGKPKPGSEDEPHDTDHPEGATETPGSKYSGKPQAAGSDEMPYGAQHHPQGSELPQKPEPNVRPTDSIKTPGSDGNLPSTTYPDDIGVTGKPGEEDKYPDGSPKPMELDQTPYDSLSPQEHDVAGEPDTIHKYPEHGKPGSEYVTYGTEYPDRVTETPGHRPLGTTKYPINTKRPETHGRPKPGSQKPHEANDPEGSELTGTPEHSTYYPHGSKYPGKPGQEPSGTEYPEVNGRPQHETNNQDKTDTGKPQGSDKYPETPYGTEYPEEDGVTGRPDSQGKYPEEVEPGTEDEPHGTEYPEGATIRPGFRPTETTKYPSGSKRPVRPGYKPHGSETPYGTEYPEGEDVTGKPIGSDKHPEEDETHGTEYPEVTGKPGSRPTATSKYPNEFLNPSDSKRPLRPLRPGYQPQELDEHPDTSYSTENPEEYGTSKPGSEDKPHGTEYPEEVNKRPGFKPTKRPLKPGYKPHGSDKYPDTPYGTEYPEGEDVTGKPIGSDKHPEEDETHGTEYPEVTGKPGSRPFSGTTKHPSGSKQSLRPGQHPQTSHATEFPEGEDVTGRPGESDKYPEGESLGTEYPEGFTRRPEYPTTIFPDGSIYPVDSVRPVKPGQFKPGERPFDTHHTMGITRRPGLKPTGTSEYSKATDRPEISQQPLDVKPGSDEHAHGTKLPEEESVTETPRPTVYPEEQTREPSTIGYSDGHVPQSTSDSVHGTRYPYTPGVTDVTKSHSHGTEVTEKPAESEKYPEGFRPVSTVTTKLDSTDKYPEIGTKYPHDEAEGPNGFSEKVKPVYGATEGPAPTTSGYHPHGSKRPESTKPGFGNNFPQEVTGKPEDYGTERPEYLTREPFGTENPFQNEGTSKLPGRPETRPVAEEFPEESVTRVPEGSTKEPLSSTYPGSENEPYATEHPEDTEGAEKPEDHSKYPGTSKYPETPHKTGSPESLSKHPDTPEHPGSTLLPVVSDDSSVTRKPDDSSKYPGQGKPENEDRPHGTDYPGQFEMTGAPEGSTKYPHGSKHPGQNLYGTDSPFATIYPENTGSTPKPEDLIKHTEQGQPGFEDITEIPGSKPTGTKHSVRPVDKPNNETETGTSKYPEEVRPGDDLHSTEHPDGITYRPAYSSTGSPTYTDGSEHPFYPGYKPQDFDKHPESVTESDGVTDIPGYKPTGTSKYPDNSLYPIGSKHPIKPGYKPDGFEKYPETSYGTEYPEENGVTGRPDSQGKFPERVKPGSEGELHGTEYPEGVTGRPTGTTRFPDGSEYPHGSEKPVRPGSFKPHDEDKVGTSKHPEDGKPGTEDELYGSEYPEGTTDRPGFRPTGTSKYPVRPGHKPHGSETPYGTEYPEGEDVTGKPIDSDKHPEEDETHGTEYPEVTGKPGSRPAGTTIYPGDSKRPLRPGQFKPYDSDKFPEKPVGSADTLYGTEKPEEHGVTYKYPLSGTPGSENVPHSTENPDKPTGQSEHSSKYPEFLKPGTEKYPDRPGALQRPGGSPALSHKPGSETPYGTEYPEITENPEGEFHVVTDENESTVTPGSGDKHPESSSSVPLPHEPFGGFDASTKQPQYAGVTGRPLEQSKYPGKPGEKPFGTTYPDVTGRPDGSEDPYGTEYPKVPGNPQDETKHPEKTGTGKPHDSSQYPEGFTDGPASSDKYPEDGKPESQNQPSGTEYPEGATGRPGYTTTGTTKHPDGLLYPSGSKLPLRPQYKPQDAETHSGSEYPEGGVTDRPGNEEKRPEKGRPENYPQETENPEEATSNLDYTPTDTSKHPPGFKPSVRPELFKPEDENKTGSTKSPEDEKPDDNVYGTEYTTGIPHRPEYGSVGTTTYPDGSKHPLHSGYKPQDFNKRPESGTEYPDVTHTPEYKPTGTSSYPEAGKPDSDETQATEYPGGITGRPVLRPIKRPLKPHDANKYPETSYGTVYPEEEEVTGRPNSQGNYPEESKPSSDDEPHSTEYPEGVTGSPGFKPLATTKYPEGSLYPTDSKRPVRPGNKPVGLGKYPEKPYGTEYPEENITVRPHGSNKPPEKGKPDDQTHGTEYPEGVTGRPGLEPHSTTIYSDGSKRPLRPGQNIPYDEDKTETHKHSEDGKPGSENVPQGTEYPEGVTDRPGFRPTETIKYPSGSKRPVKPGHIPHGSDKYPETPYGTEYPEEDGVTGRPDSQGKYPEEVEPGTEDEPHGTEYPEGATIRPGFRPTETTKYPSGSKRPVRPGYKPHGSETPYGTEYPEGEDVTGKPIGSDKHPEEDETHGTEYPEVTGKPGSRPLSGTTKYPSGSKQSLRPGQHPQTSHATEYPEGEEDVTEIPNGSEKYPVEGKPGSDDKPEGADHYPEEVSGYKPVATTNHPSGSKRPVKPEDSDKLSEKPYGTEYPVGVTKGPGYSSEDPEKEVPGTKNPIGTVYLPEGGRPTGSVPDEDHLDENSVPFEGSQRPESSTLRPGSSTEMRPSEDVTHKPEKEGITKYPGEGASPGDKLGPTGEPGTAPGSIDDFRPQSHDTSATRHPEVTGAPGVQPGSASDGKIPHDDLVTGTQGPGFTGMPTQVPEQTGSHVEYSTTQHPSDNIFNSVPDSSGKHPSEEVSDVTKHPETPDTDLNKDEITTLYPDGFHPTRRPEEGQSEDKTTPGGDDLINKLHNIISGIQSQTTSPVEGATESSFDHPTIDEFGRPKPQEGGKLPEDPNGFTTPGKYPTDTAQNEIYGHTTIKPTSGTKVTGELPTGGKAPEESHSTEEISSEYPGSHTSKPGLTSKYPEIGQPGGEGVNTESKPFDEFTEKPEQSYDSEHPGSEDTPQEQVTQYPYQSSPSSLSGYPGQGVQSTPDSSTGTTHGKEHVLGSNTHKPGDSIKFSEGTTPGPHYASSLPGIFLEPTTGGSVNYPGKPEDINDPSKVAGTTLTPHFGEEGTRRPQKPTQHGQPAKHPESEDKTTGPEDSQTKKPTEDDLQTVTPQDVSHKHPLFGSTDKPLHVVYPTYYPDGVVTRKPGSKPQVEDSDPKVTVTPQSTIDGVSTPLGAGKPGETHTVYEVHTEISSETATTPSVVIVQEVHTEVHSERPTTRPDFLDYDKLTTKPGEYGTESSQKSTKKPEVVYGRPGITHPGDESVPGSQVTEKPDQTQHLDTHLPTGEPFVTVTPVTGTTPKESQHIMHLYSPKDKHPSSTSPDQTHHLEAFTTASPVYPDATEKGSSGTQGFFVTDENAESTEKPEFSNQGPTFEHEIFGTRFPTRKPTQKPIYGEPERTTALPDDHQAPLYVFPQPDEATVGQSTPPSTEGSDQTTSHFLIVTPETQRPQGASYVPYKLINGTKIYYPEKEEPKKPEEKESPYDGYDLMPFEIVNGTKFFYPNRVAEEPEPTSTTTSHPLGMYVPYKIINGMKVYYTQDPPQKPEKYDGLDYVPFDVVNGTKVFHPEKIVPSTNPPPSALYVPYKIINGTKMYYPKDAKYQPQNIPDGYDGFDYVPYDVVNGTKVFRPERVPSNLPTMYVPYKLIDGKKVFYPKDALKKPLSVPEEYDGYDLVPYDTINGTRVFYPERIKKPSKQQGMYVPYKVINGTKVFYPKDAKDQPMRVPEVYDGVDYIPYDVVNGTKVFHPERVPIQSAYTPTFRPNGMFVPYKVINGSKVFYPKDAQNKPRPLKEGYDGVQYLPYDVINGTKVFYPEEVTTPATVEKTSPSAMYVPFKIINGTKVYYADKASYNPHEVLDGYDGFDYVPYEIVDGSKVFYPERVAPTTSGMFVPYRIVNGTKVYYPKDATETPQSIPDEYDGVDYMPYEMINGTRVFYPDRVKPDSSPAAYVPFKVINGTKVFYPKDAKNKPYLIPQGYDGFELIPYDVVNGTKVFRPEKTTTPRPAPTHPQGMFVPYKIINGTKVYYPKEAHKRPHPLSDEYAGLDYIPYETINGTKVFYPERVANAMYVPYKLINGNKVFYPKDAQPTPQKFPEEYDGFDYVPYEIVNETQVFYPNRVPSYQGMYVPYRIINGEKVFDPKHAQHHPTQVPDGYDGLDYLPYEVVNGTKVFTQEQVTESPYQQAMYVPYKIANGTKVFYPKDAQHKPHLVPEGYNGFEYIPYEIVDGNKVFKPELARKPAMYVPYKIVDGTKVYYTKYAQNKPHSVPEGYDGFDYIPYTIVNGTKVFDPEQAVTPATSIKQAMFVPYKLVNGTKVFYPKDAQNKPHAIPFGYDGFEYIPYEIVNGEKVFHPEQVLTPITEKPLSQAMYVPYKMVNGTKVYYPKYAQHKPHLVPSGYDGFDFIPYEIVNGNKVFHPEQITKSETPVRAMYVPYKLVKGTKVYHPKYAQGNPYMIPHGYDGVDYVPYDVVNGNKVFRPEQAVTPGVSFKPAMYVPYKMINGTKVYYPKQAQQKPSQIPGGYDGFDYLPYDTLNGTNVFDPTVPAAVRPAQLQGMYVPFKHSNNTKVFYPRDAHNKPNVPAGYDGVEYVPYEPVNHTKVFYPELISTAAPINTGIPGVYVPFRLNNGKKVFFPKEASTSYPPNGVKPYDGVAFVPYKDLGGTSRRPGTSEIVYVDDEDELTPQHGQVSSVTDQKVPGEGNCYLNHKTYANNTEIPPVNPCQAKCMCISSIVRCVRVKCPAAPKNKIDCSPVYREGSCCPIYACGDSESEYPTTIGYYPVTKVPELHGSSSFGHGTDSTAPFPDFSSQKKPSDVTGGIKPEVETPTDEYHLHRPTKPKPSEHESLEPYDHVEGQLSPDEDYDGEDEEPYGPGTCRYAGKVYVSAQQIPRDDPCDFCFCFRSDIICLQQSCPPPIPGCRDEPIQGFCCPRYECHVKMATLVNVTSTTTTTTTTLPPHFFPHAFKGSATKTGCFVQGKAYRVGQPIPSASGPCMDCTCGGNGRMKCEPKVCTPEPMIRKMIVPAENATSPTNER